MLCWSLWSWEPGAALSAAVQNKAGEKCDPGLAEVPAGVLSVSQPEPFTCNPPEKKWLGSRITGLKRVLKVLARRLCGWGGKLGSELPLIKSCCFAWSSLRLTVNFSSWFIYFFNLFFLYSSSQIWDIKGLFFHIFADASSRRKDEIYEDFFSRQRPVVQRAFLRKAPRETPAPSPRCSDAICGAGARACAASDGSRNCAP